MFRELIFNFRFGSKKHVSEYVELVNSLIQQGRQRVFASEQEIQKSVESGTCPKVDTSNHIRMMYSIFTSKDGMRHHLSISRSPYLATRYAKHLSALFCNLSGLPIPEVVYQSAQSVYHVEFVLSPTQQDRFEGLAQ